MVGQALRRLRPLLVVGALLIVAAIAASLSSVGLHRVPVRSDAPSPIPSARPASSSTPTPQPTRSTSGDHSLVTVPHWLKLALLVLVVVVVAALIITVIGYAIRNASESRARLSVRVGGTRQTVNRREEVLATVDATMDDLARDDGDARSAVILCWVRLEQVAAAAGIERAPGDSPTDLVARLLRAHRVSAPVLDSLADLYRLARYSRHEIPRSMRDDARAALGRLRAELALARTASADGDAVPAGTLDGRPRPRRGGGG